MDSFSPMMTGRSSDPDIGASVYKVLRVSPNDLIFAKQQDRIADIIDFATEYKDGVHLMKLAIAKKPSDLGAVEFIHEYVTMRREHANLSQRVAQLKKELSRYE